MRARRGISQCDATEGSIVTFKGRVRRSGKFDDAAVDFADRLFDPVRQRASLRRQFKPPREALEQAEAEFFLQPANAVTDRALR